MPGVLTRLAGPAGAGKSQRARQMLDAGEADVLADFTSVYAAISGVERDPATGRYPVRRAGDPLLPLASYLRNVVAREGLRRGFRVLKTSSTRADRDADVRLAAAEGADFAEVVIDPGWEVVRARLADAVTGELSTECDHALGRWYS